MRFQYIKAPRPKDLSVDDGIGKSALDLKTVARAIPCQEACPVKTNVPLYIEMIAQGRHDDAYRVNQEDNVFPGVLGRICTRVCEDKCRHNWTNVEGPVQICHLKRYAADHIREKQTALPPMFGPSGKKVAVVGAGPAGLAAARELARLGHEVTVFERSPKAGGMLVDGIPAFRLPRAVVEAEIDLIVQGGVTIKTNDAVDVAKLTTLRDSHDAVLLAAGTTVAHELKIEGQDEGVVSGLAFMQRFNRGQQKRLKGDVVVIGGGFTAVDCARAARRLVDTGTNVTIAYRRTEASMAADKNEFLAMEKERVSVRTLLSPVRMGRLSSGKKGLVLQRNMVTGGLSDDKPAIAAIDGAFVEIPCDTVIIAIGQRVDDQLLPDGAIQSDGFATSLPGLFTAGDFRGGSADVVSAVAAGKEAAYEMDQFLLGEKRVTPVVEIETIEGDGETGRVRDHDIQWPLSMQMRPFCEGPDADGEVELGFSDEQVQNAATRCYLCHYKFEIDQDVCIHCDWCIQAAPRDCIKKAARLFSDKDGYVTRVLETEISKDATYIYIDNDKCIRCGKCLRVCPVEAISMKKLARKLLRGDDGGCGE